MERTAEIKRETKETEISVKLNLDGSGKVKISTGIPFYDHMLTLFAVHGFFQPCVPYIIDPYFLRVVALTGLYSNIPTVYNVPPKTNIDGNTFTVLTKEFLRAFSNRCGMNLHVNVSYGENEHHINESIFKAAGRALDQAASIDVRIKDIHSTKGTL
ncbi:MAG: imidazoleglycerol-phosphate dehydratase [Deltaproteobacteria bacterium]|nr:imidazoleglycerol-phosphate dehydratase [Deltaproteobacteria bacterium]